MSIFRRDSGSPSTPPNPQPRERPESTSSPATTLVAKGSKITGQITGQSPIRVSGELDGSIRVDQAVLISPEGRVDGDIRARTARIGGQVTGDVHATERVEVTPSGSLEGNIRAPRVILEEGAFFKGQVEMVGDAGESPSKRPPAASQGKPPVNPQASSDRRDAGGERKPPEDRKKAETGSGSTKGDAS